MALNPHRATWYVAPVFETTTLRTFLWYPGDLDEVLDFYRATFQKVTIHSENRREDGSLFTADFSVFGHEFIAMSHPGGPAFTDAVSLSVNCDGQEEVDALWDAITAEGQAGQCGWCKDKFGVSWQISPIQMRDYLGNSDPDAAAYAWEALRRMGKIVLTDFVP